MMKIQSLTALPSAESCSCPGPLSLCERSDNETIRPGDRVILFTRFPEPGTTKTRLIPALGAEGAARLHRRLTGQAAALLASLPRSISREIWHAGGSEAAMRQWLGKQFRYRPQPAGNLGRKMLAALDQVDGQGKHRTIIIGSDCPGLSRTVIMDALALLNNHDLVLGPAMDGGYYLIGLRGLWRELFSGIAWGSARVLSQTLAEARKLDLSCALLPLLNDIDRPADLGCCPP